MVKKEFQKLNQILPNNASQELIEYAKRFINFRIVYLKYGVADDPVLVKIIEKIGETDLQTNFVKLPNNFEELRKKIIILNIDELEKLKE